MTSRRQRNLIGAFALASHDLLTGALERTATAVPSRAAALVTLRFSPGDSVDGLARTLGLTGSGTTRLVNQLQADGLVEKRAGDDARVVRLYLTKAGERHATEVLDARTSWLDTLLAPLGDADRRELARLAEVVLLHLDEATQPGDQTCRLCDIASCPQDRCPVVLAGQCDDAS